MILQQDLIHVHLITWFDSAVCGGAVLENAPRKILECPLPALIQINGSGEASV
jgi:hypothetical protein